MKLAFSTLACPTWTFNETVSAVKDLGFDALEIRGVLGELYAPKIKELTVENLIDRDVKISMLSSSAQLAVHSAKNALAEAKDYINLAVKLAVPFVRVLSTDTPQYDGGDTALFIRQYAAVLRYAEGSGVEPLIETNGLFVNTARLADVLEKTGGGALWDIHHPFRFGGESVSETVANLKNLIKYVHVKDSVVTNGAVKYRLLGSGTVPVAEAVAALEKIGYDGYYSLEWVKRWDLSLEESAIAIPHYASFMRSL
ncbi:MAG: sugar phosphate isomerase/epimerase [Clostridiaceae bacterium]|jgi:fatty-acyl-CoA synthase|nr:sugar phosphate isomerase/epimerase [Clostridiaceae bacterium]